MKVRSTRKVYSHAIADANKARRCEEANVRQKARSLRSSTEQLDRLDTGGHIAKRERARLLKLK